jgi:hypothetical protein
MFNKNRVNKLLKQSEQLEYAEKRKVLEALINKTAKEGKRSINFRANTPNSYPTFEDIAWLKDLGFQVFGPNEDTLATVIMYWD